MLFLSTAQRLFGFESNPGPDGLSPSLVLPSTKAVAPESPHTPILKLPIILADPLDENHPPPISIASAHCFVSTVPEQLELGILDQAERGEGTFASATAPTETPLAGGLDSSEQPIESAPKVATGPEDRVHQPGAWKMVARSPSYMRFTVCVCALSSF